jgi:hypothetical protein
LPSATLGKAFAECFYGFAECFRHSAKRPFPVVIYNKLMTNIFILDEFNIWHSQIYHGHCLSKPEFNPETSTVPTMLGLLLQEPHATFTSPSYPSHPIWITSQ